MLEKITQILREYKSDDSLEVTPETTFEQMELDSLDTVELVMNMEDEFGVSDLEMSDKIKTVGDLMQLIKDAE